MSRFVPGDRAPTFTAHTYAGQPFDLAERLRTRRVWLAFFRYASCPLCNLRLHELAEVWPRFQDADVDMVAVFHSPHESIDRWLTERRPPIDIVIDPELELYDLYATERSLARMVSPAVAGRFVKAHAKGYFQRKVDGTLAAVPADFLIDRDGVIRDCQYGKNIVDHIPLPRVEKWIDGSNAAVELGAEPVPST